MNVIALVAVLAAAQAPAPAAPAPATEAAAAPAARRSVVVLDLEASGVEPHQAALVSGLLVDALAKYEAFDVLQKQDIQQMAAFEADKQMLGCSEASCLAEIAGALGAAYVVFGRVGVLDQLILVQLNLFDAAAGKPVARQDIRVKKLDEVANVMANAVGKLVQPLTGLEPPPIVEDEGDSPLLLGLRWGGVGVAGLGVVVGSVGAVGAGYALATVTNKEAPADVRNDSKPLGLAMVATTAVAAGVLVVGGAAFGLSFLGGEQ